MTAGVVGTRGAALVERLHRARGALGRPRRWPHPGRRHDRPDRDGLAGRPAPYRLLRADPPIDSADAYDSDRAAFGRFYRSMLGQGVLLPPSPFEAWFPSMAHGPAEIAATIAAATTAFQETAE